MTEADTAAPVAPEDRRRAAFAALVAAQDGGETVLAAREAVSRAFGLTAREVRQVEHDGIEWQWPPLGG